MLRHFLERVRSRWAVQSDREAVCAVDAVGLPSLLDDAGVRRRFERGDMSCKFCGTPVIETNLYALAKESGAIKVVCSKPQCISRFVEWIEGH